MPAAIRKLQLLVAATWAEQYDTQAPVNSGVIANTAGATLLSVVASNKSSTTLYLMFFDATALPNNGSVPVMTPIALKQDTPLNLRLNDGPGGNTLFGLKFDNGITFAVSTTSDTLTVDASSSVWATVRYQN